MLADLSIGRRDVDADIEVVFFFALVGFGRVEVIDADGTSRLFLFALADEL